MFALFSVLEYCDQHLERNLSLTLVSSHVLLYHYIHFADPSDCQTDGEKTDENLMGEEGQIPAKVYTTHQTERLGSFANFFAHHLLPM